MKVIHLIPSAFNYFDDIRAEAFRLVENLYKFGVDAEAFALQYETVPSKKTKAEIGEAAPSRKFVGMANIKETMSALADFDVVHLHAPFLGAAGEIIRWKKLHPRIPLAITYYRRVRLADIISLGIVWYNMYYLPKLFSLANVVVCSSSDIFKKQGGRRHLADVNKLVIIDDSNDFVDQPLTNPADEVELSAEERIAAKYSILYQQLTQSKR